MIHQQLLQRNHIYFSELVQTYHELNSVYDNQYVFYMDMNVFELFDSRVSRVIIRHKISHYRNFISDMTKLKNDIVNVGCAVIRLNRYLRPKQCEGWSIKSLLKHYPITDNYFFNQSIINYINHGKINKTKVMADCY